jgi:hypothetical protein
MTGDEKNPSANPHVIGDFSQQKSWRKVNFFVRAVKENRNKHYEISVLFRNIWLTSQR